MSSDFAAAALADDDAFGPHTQGVADQVARRDRALAFDVRRPRFQTDDVVLLELQFGGVLDGHHAFVVRDEARQRVEQRRLAATGAAADDDVQPGLDARLHQHGHFRRERLVVEQVFQLQRVGCRNGECDSDGAVQGERRNDGVDAGAVRQAGIHHRRRFIDAPADLRHDAVDDLQQMVVVAELDVGLLQLAAAFDVDLVRAVDQDIADGRVLEQHFQRAEAERLVEHLVDEALAFHAVEQRVFGVAQALDDQADFAAQRVAGQVADPRQVELIDQFAVDVPFQFFEALVGRPASVACRPCWRRRACRHACCSCSIPVRPRCRRDMSVPQRLKSARR